MREYILGGNREIFSNLPYSRLIGWADNGFAIFRRNVLDRAEALGLNKTTVCDAAEVHRTYLDRSRLGPHPEVVERFARAILD